jgi:gluconolactonase
MTKDLVLGLLVVLNLQVQWTSAAESDIFPSGSKLEMLFTGGVLTEGAAAAPDGAIYFSDITFTYTSGMQAGHIMKYDPKIGKVSVFRSPSGMSNGIKFDAQGRMVVAEGADYGGRRITRTDMSSGKSVILAGLYEGRPLNSPNDIAIDEEGHVFFSDPRYLGYEPIEQPVMAVYRIDLDGSLHRVITDAGKPNGVAVSPDQKTLYVVSNDNGTTGMFRLPAETPLRRGSMALLAYDLHSDGTAKFRKILVDYAPEDGPDGLVVDKEGNLFVAVRALSRPGIYVYSPEGKELARIQTPVLPTNVGFGRGAERSTLYITAGGNLYRIKTNKQGYELPPDLSRKN